MTIATLNSSIEKLKAKLADPHDGDDKRWVAGCLRRCERRLSKKERNLQQKQALSRKRRREPESLLPGQEI